VEQSSVWIIGIVALAIGAVIGYLLGRSGGDNSQQEQLTKQLEETQQELNGYKEQVNTHFARTAELVNNLTESYKEVHQHLASSAQSLCKDGAAAQSLEASLQPRLEEKETVEVPTVTEAVPNAETDNIPEPPRDYAPKKADEEGTLSETYGLQEKSEPVPQSPADLVETAETEAEPEKKPEEPQKAAS